MRTHGSAPINDVKLANVINREPLGNVLRIKFQYYILLPYPSCGDYSSNRLCKRDTDDNENHRIPEHLVGSRMSL